MGTNTRVQPGALNYKRLAVPEDGGVLEEVELGVCLLPSQAVSLQCGTGVILLFWVSLVHLVTFADLAIHS